MSAQARLEILVGGRDDPHVHLDGLRAPHTLEAALLQDAEQLHLDAVGELADLVEEDGAPVGHLEASPPLAHGAGEGSLLVPEELRLDEGLREGHAVHRHEGLLLPRRVLVQGLGEELLARPALSEEQDGHVLPGHGIHVGKGLLDRRTLPHDPGVLVLRQGGLLRLEGAW